MRVLHIAGLPVLQTVKTRLVQVSQSVGIARLTNQVVHRFDRDGTLASLVWLVELFPISGSSGSSRSTHVEISTNFPVGLLGVAAIQS